MAAKKANANAADEQPEGAPSFEASMERLERIVAEMESGSLSLEQMVKRFEEGQALVALCSKTLNEVERKVEILVKKGGEVEVEPFEPSEGGDGNGKDEGG